jgi:hypothetical protein
MKRSLKHCIVPLSKIPKNHIIVKKGRVYKYIILEETIRGGEGK